MNHLVYTNGIPPPNEMIIFDKYLYISNINNTIVKISLENTIDINANWASGLNNPTWNGYI